MQYLGMYPNITPLTVELAKEMRENISTVLRNMLDRLEPGEDMSVYHFTVSVRPTHLSKRRHW